MAKKARNSNLQKAKKVKNDEFYTQLTDIEKELLHYRDKFRGKVIYCNCDDPTESEFYRYFHLNFHFFGMKKLISTHYDKDKPTYALIYQGGENEMSDNDYNSYDEKIPLKENGDFRSKESIAYLKQADIVVTNPPFSLFSEYINQLTSYQKKFIVIGNMNAITYKAVFPLLSHNKIWLGINHPTKFVQPDGTIKTALGRWYTNIHSDFKSRERTILWNSYAPDKFPIYDNYAAFECGKVNNIPKDNSIIVDLDLNQYNQFARVYGSDLTKLSLNSDETIKVEIEKPIWGVPISVMDKWQPLDEYTSASKLTLNPDTINLADKFKIVGATESEGKGFSNGIFYSDAKIKQPLINGKKKYKRIFIRLK